MNFQPPDPPDHGNCPRCRASIDRSQFCGDCCTECRGRRLTPAERQGWMLQYLRENPGGVDCLNYELEDVYVVITGASHKCMMRDARALYADGKLKRTTLPSTMPYAGCCKWVRHYCLALR